MVRVKRRYIVAKFVCKQNQGSFDHNDVMSEITNQVASSYGDFGVGCLKRLFQLKKYDHYHGFMIIQVRKGVHEMVMSVLPLISKFRDTLCEVNIVHLSGTLRSSLKHLKQRHTMDLRASIAKKMASDAARKTKMVAMQ